MTPVYKKPEFWITVGTSVSGLLLAFGVITKEQSDGIVSYLPNIVGGIMTLFSTLNFTTCQTKAKIEVFRAMCDAESARRSCGADHASASSDAALNVREYAEKSGL